MVLGNTAGCGRCVCVEAFVLLFLMLCRAQLCVSLTCSCDQTPHQFDKTDCVLSNNSCNGSLTSNGMCYLRHKLIGSGSEVLVTRKCITRLSHSDIRTFCNKFTDTVRIKCCNADYCNKNLTLPPFSSVYPPSTSFSFSSFPVTTSLLITPLPTSLAGSQPQDDHHGRIMLIIVSFVLFLTTIFSISIFMYILWKRKKKSSSEQLHCEQHMMNGGVCDPSPLYVPYSLETLDLGDQTYTSGSGSGEPLLTQRTVAQCIKIGESIGSGRYGQVFIGEYQADRLAVKKFASRDEQSWFRESEIYNTVLLRHDNILGFFASDVFSNNGVTELWLITQYHPNGSLYDYLNQKTVSPKIMMKMAISTCKGLTHLHTEFSGICAKPAIAHRDIKSKNILVKVNRECCIADFGLAVMKGPSSNINFPMNPKQGTKRYMAPEILAETINMNSFEAFKKSDIYAFGLVLWEICKRCADKNDSVAEYVPPFYDLVGEDPSFEEMKKVIVVDKHQPIIPSHWDKDDLLSGTVRLMKECWYFDSAARNNAIFYKTKLYELAEENKIEFEF